MQNNNPMITDIYYQRPPNLPDRTSAGGVVCRICPQSNQVLFAVVLERGMGRRAVLPKGGVESGESFIEAAQREIGEEAGIHHLQPIQKLGVNQRMGFRKNNWSTTHFYLFLTDQVEFQPTDCEHDYCPEWRPIDQIGDLFWPDQQELILEKRESIKQVLQEYHQNEVAYVSR